MEELKCPKCGQNLSPLRWSGEKNIFVCINGNCQAYRNPVSNFSTVLHAENKTPLKPLLEMEGILRPYLPKYNISTGHHFIPLTRWPA